MKITFLGAAREVTGSCTYIEVGDKRGIVDCGMEQGRDVYVNAQLPVAAHELDFVLLTHAHVDHSGRLPLLYKQGYRGPVYTSAATASLCQIMLRDCAHIQESDAAWKNKKNERSGKGMEEPLYTMADAEGILRQMIPCRYNEPIQVNDCVSIRLTDVGHLLGSAAIEVWLTENGETRKITFSGDIGNLDQPILRDPEYVHDSDFVVIESTYGDRYHIEERADYITELSRRIQKTLDRNGNVVIPSFAVGRTQEILYFIREIKEKGLVTGHGDFPVYVDSPLAVEATSVFLQCDTHFVDEEMAQIIRSGVNPLVFRGLSLSVTQADSRSINQDKSPKVILSASGMCDAGRIRHHLKHNLWRPESMILFVGYQSEGSLGRLIADGAEKVRILGDEVQVRAEVDVLPGVSGHADKQGLLNWLGGFEKKPKLVFVNHGETDSADSFARCLEEEHGYRANAPFSGTCYDLLREEFETVTEGIPITGRTRIGDSRSVTVFRSLMAAAERLTRTVRQLEGRANKELNGYLEQIDALIAEMEE